MNAPDNNPGPDKEEPEVVNTDEARQGQRSFAMRVLIISLALIVLAFAITYFFGEATDESDPVQTDQPEDITEMAPPPNVPEPALEDPSE